MKEEESGCGFLGRFQQKAEPGFLRCLCPQTTFKSEENAIINLLDSGFWRILLLWEILNDFGGLPHKIPSEAVDKTTLFCGERSFAGTFLAQTTRQSTKDPVDLILGV